VEPAFSRFNAFYCLLTYKTNNRKKNFIEEVLVESLCQKELSLKQRETSDIDRIEEVYLQPYIWKRVKHKSRMNSEKRDIELLNFTLLVVCHSSKSQKRFLYLFYGY